MLSYLNATILVKQVGNSELTPNIDIKQYFKQCNFKFFHSSSRWRIWSRTKQSSNLDRKFEDGNMVNLIDKPRGIDTRDTKLIADRISKWISLGKCYCVWTAKIGKVELIRISGDFTQSLPHSRF